MVGPRYRKVLIDVVEAEVRLYESWECQNLHKGNVVKYSENDLDQALEAGFINNVGFADWFLAKSKFSQLGAKYKWSRSDSPWGRFDFKLIDPDSGERLTEPRDSETDVLVIFESDELTFALHIENKLRDGHFTKFQVESYPLRAREWLNTEKFGNYTDFQTVLVAPIEFYGKNYQQAKGFDFFVSYEEISFFLEAFRRYLDS